LAGHGTYTALLDANVLYPIAICDALMEVSCTGIYAAKWTSQIDDEWIRNLAADRGLDEEKLHCRRDQMHDACPDWEVPFEAWKSIESSLTLPDQGDCHVLAAAIVGHADCIVTCNLRHFPPESLEPFGITALHPDEFIHHQLQLNPLGVLPAFKAMRNRKSKPPYTPAQFTDAMAHNGLLLTADFLRQALELI
jgi:hypothetical protein